MTPDEEDKLWKERRTPEWIAQAIVDKNPRLELRLAHSIPFRVEPEVIGSMYMLDKTISWDVIWDGENRN